MAIASKAYVPQPSNFEADERCSFLEYIGRPCLTDQIKTKTINVLVKINIKPTFSSLWYKVGRETNKSEGILYLIIIKIKRNR